jgi:hypothetical protein
MQRIVVDLGEMTRFSVGATLNRSASSGARGQLQPARSCQNRNAPSQPRQRPGCKTCNGDKCVGHCRF